ncbi:MAG: hypothetical protein ACKOBM_10000, partial [Gammaproteobacteria bacterium]
TALCVGDAEPMLLVTADLIAIPEALRTRALAALAHLDWLQPDRFSLTATHSHSAPVPMAATGHDPATEAFTRQLIDGIVAAASAARLNQQSGLLLSGIGDVRLGFNRWRPDDPDAVDTRVPVVVALAADSHEPVAILFGAGCHPTTFGWDNMQISADYPGVAKQRLRAIHSDCVPMFVNTTEGDVVPSTSARRDALDPRGYQGNTAAHATTIGTALADEVVRVVASLRKGLQPPSPAHGQAPDPADAPGAAEIITRMIAVLPNTPTADEAELTDRLQRASALLAHYLGEDFPERVGAARLWAAASDAVIRHELGDDAMRDLMIACCHFIGLNGRLGRPRVQRSVNVPVQLVTLDQARFLVLPGEVLVAVGARWRALVGSEHAFVIACGNAHHRYLPLASHFAEPGADRRYETVTAGLAPGAVEQLLEAGAALLPGGRAQRR